MEYATGVIDRQMVRVGTSSHVPWVQERHLPDLHMAQPNVLVAISLSKACILHVVPATRSISSK
jgi:hypothetical protein